MEATLPDLLRPYNQKRVAEHLGVTRATVHLWATGQNVPASDKIAPLAQFLRVDIGRLAELVAASAEKRKAEVGRAS